MCVFSVQTFQGNYLSGREFASHVKDPGSIPGFSILLHGWICCRLARDEDLGPAQALLPTCTFRCHQVHLHLSSQLAHVILEGDT